mmetsp:Transcript_12028/g.39897  ORF Transcript_12028/g.39897 Transcript_12028/m.39897 type:complete len:258 (+) Transcript_12028:706-1479(+)
MAGGARTAAGDPYVRTAEAVRTAAMKVAAVRALTTRTAAVPLAARALKRRIPWRGVAAMARRATGKVAARRSSAAMAAAKEAASARRAVPTSAVAEAAAGRATRATRAAAAWRRGGFSAGRHYRGARVAATRHRRRHWRHHHRRSNNVPRREEAARQAYTAASPICRTPAPTSRRLRAFPGPHRCRHQTPPPEPVPTQWAPLFLVFCRPDPLRQSLRDAPARRAPRPRRAALAAARRRHDLIPGATAKSAAGCTPLA